ncbi:MAG: very short patch repair endonuclease [Bifidobacteriaceae bacterium]|nr:very short patch repair endonuclease [Bifidobacteriaceae bacterium]
MPEADSWASTPAVRRSMQANRSRDTGPEIALRKLLFARGLRYRVSYKPLADKRVTVDIAFPGPRLIVLVDGCFWHGCPLHHRLPKTNTDYWRAKIDRNVERDAAVSARLEAAGWRVLRFWEHEDFAAAAQAVEQTVRALPRAPGSAGPPGYQPLPGGAGQGEDGGHGQVAIARLDLDDEMHAGVGHHEQAQEDRQGR